MRSYWMIGRRYLRPKQPDRMSANRLVPFSISVVENRHLIEPLPPNHVVPGIDIMDFAGHAAGHVAGEVEAGLADLLGLDVAAEWALGGIVFENLVKSADARRTERATGAGA